MAGERCASSRRGASRSAGSRSGAGRVGPTHIASTPHLRPRAPVPSNPARRSGRGHPAPHRPAHGCKPERREGHRTARSPRSITASWAAGYLEGSSPPDELALRRPRGLDVEPTASAAGGFLGARRRAGGAAGPSSASGSVAASGAGPCRIGSSACRPATAARLRTAGAGSCVAAVGVAVVTGMVGRASALSGVGASAVAPGSSTTVPPSTRTRSVAFVARPRRWQTSAGRRSQPS